MFSYCSFVRALLPLCFKSEQDCINPQNIYTFSMLLLSTSWLFFYFVDCSPYNETKIAIDSLYSFIVVPSEVFWVMQVSSLCFKPCLLHVNRDILSNANLNVVFNYVLFMSAGAFLAHEFCIVVPHCKDLHKKYLWFIQRTKKCKLYKVFVRKYLNNIYSVICFYSMFNEITFLCVQKKLFENKLLHMNVTS